MFFRRERPKHLTFEDHMSAARAAGFRTESIGGGKIRIERNEVAAVFEGQLCLVLLDLRETGGSHRQRAANLRRSGHAMLMVPHGSGGRTAASFFWSG